MNTAHISPAESMNMKRRLNLVMIKAVMVAVRRLQQLLARLILVFAKVVVYPIMPKRRLE